MKVSRGRISASSEITIDEDLDFLSTYQVKGLASPASGEALRKGSKDIANAEVADAAAVAYSKLNLTGLIRNADIKSDAAIALSKLASTVLTDTQVAALIAAENHPTILRKASDETVNNSETLQNDDDLVLAVGANDVWLIELVVFMISPSVTPDIDWLFAVPSGGAVRGLGYVSLTTLGAYADLTSEATLAVLTTERAIRAPMLYIGGGTAGNLQLQWAQHTGTAEDTKVKANSLMLCHKIA